MNLPISKNILDKLKSWIENYTIFKLKEQSSKLSLKTAIYPSLASWSCSFLIWLFRVRRLRKISATFTIYLLKWELKMKNKKAWLSIKLSFRLKWMNKWKKQWQEGCEERKNVVSVDDVVTKDRCGIEENRTNKCKCHG